MSNHRDFIHLESQDVKVTLYRLGASIYRIFTPNREGTQSNIVLSFDDVNEYKKKHPYFGLTCGRCAGRIKNSEFTIDNQVYKLSQNDGHNHLHGGFDSLSTLYWDYTLTKNGDQQVCIFTITSSHLSEGYPGTISAKVSYTLCKNKLTVVYDVQTDRRTYINLTNHSYFNLSNNLSIPIYNHLLKINAYSFSSLDDKSIPNDIKPVVRTYFDFIEMKKIGDLTQIKDVNISNEHGLNHPFLLDSADCLTLKNIETGRDLSVTTSYPAVILYSYNYPLTHHTDSHLSKMHTGLAIECQYVPNAMNSEIFNQPLISPDNPYHEWISYEFSTF